MNTASRIIIIATSFLVCAAAIIVTNSDCNGWAEKSDESRERMDLCDGYQYAASEPQIRNRKELEIAILLKTPKTPCKWVELGSIRMDKGTALVPVFFFSFYDEMDPFLYKLVPDGNSWKVESVQRMWFVPRSRLLRGLRV